MKVAVVYFCGFAKCATPEQAALPTDWEGFMWLWAVLWCREVWWGWALPTERLWRQRETVVCPVVAADRVLWFKVTTPNERKQRPSTVAWPLWKATSALCYYILLAEHNISEHLTCTELPACHNCSTETPANCESAPILKMFIQSGVVLKMRMPTDTVFKVSRGKTASKRDVPQGR